MTDTENRSSPIASALIATLESPNEADRNLEAANVVDGLFFIGRAIYALSASLERLSADDAESSIYVACTNCGKPWKLSRERFREGNWPYQPCPKCASSPLPAKENDR